MDKKKFQRAKQIIIDYDILDGLIDCLSNSTELNQPILHTFNKMNESDRISLINALIYQSHRLMNEKIRQFEEL